MRSFRIIPRLDIKQNHVIKGVQMEGWRKVGDPVLFAKEYAEKGADELLLMDVVASLYERNSLYPIIQKVASECFIPMTVGGGIKKVEDVGKLLAVGADKVVVNTAATKNSKLISELADNFGSQAIVVSIEAGFFDGSWLVMTDNGRNHTGINVYEWAKTVEKMGAGEVVITAINREGTGSGFEHELSKRVCEMLSIPVICNGGFGNVTHLEKLIIDTSASGVGIGQALH
ncbi:MAG: imidazole glycerol phosphate synthase cyclase subunit, partial [Paracoccaceae bacterium]